MAPTEAQRIEILTADITTLAFDAIVNAANEALAPGGGVCGAIHRKAGPKLAEACAVVAPCRTGRAVMTPGFNLPARNVIHAVGPVWRGGDAGEDALLRAAVAKCLELAEAYQCESVAFPAISTGVYGYPLDLAAAATLETIRDRLATAEYAKLVRLVLFGEAAYGQFARVLESLTESE
jgi:O-acetyl-ADP-ribose deacetylase (regulator of RNase III)